ncbi:MAG: hypothetical protein JWR01_227 [Subtercola sp.]|nr:hypothetical protein [Subtercola sp.]
MKTPTHALTAAVMVVLLTGCAAAHTSPEFTGQAPAQASTSKGPHDDATVIPVPDASDASRESAIAAATTVMAVFAEPSLGGQEWMTKMTPLLSPSGYDAYLGTDPAQIPAHHVTGPGTVLPGATDVALIVQVPTDAGLYTVSLSRPDTAGAWLADQIRPAAR